MPEIEKPKVDLPSLDDIKAKVDTEAISANLKEVNTDDLKDSGKDAIADAKALLNSEERQKLADTTSKAFNDLMSGSLISNEGTGWTMIYSFNAIFFTIMAVISCLSLIVV